MPFKRLLYSGHISIISSLGLFAAVTVHGQQAVFHAAVRTVAVYATVHDNHGHLVPDLTQDAFRVLDNGHPVELNVFSNEIQPITAVTLLDMSSSMDSHVADLRESMLSLVVSLLPRDRIRIGTFGDEVALSPHLTNDRVVLARIVREELWPGGGTPLWRAMDAAVTSLLPETGRRVILVLTDGVDNSGVIPGLPGGRGALKKRLIENSDFMVYAVGYFGTGLDSSIEDLADATGGGHFVVSEHASLSATFAEVADELRHQYVLGFAPLDLIGAAHKIEVRMTRPGLKARARTSYVAGGER